MHRRRYERFSSETARIPPDPRDPELANWKPRCVGAITLRGEQREFIGSLPFDSLPFLSSLHEAGRIKFIDLYGKLPSYGSADIRSVRYSPLSRQKMILNKVENLP